MEKESKDLREKLEMKIEGKPYSWNTQYITGAEIKKLAGIELEKEIYLSLKSPWTDELIANEAIVDLARPGIEEFLLRKKLKFTINKIPYVWESQFITGKQIRELGRINSDDEIFLVNQKPYENELIADDATVDLARKGVEDFITKEKPFQAIIIVNGREKQWNEKTISFSQVVILAFGTYDNNPSKVYTVTYDKGPRENPEGSMVKGDIVFIKNKMVFNVTATDKS